MINYWPIDDNTADYVGGANFSPVPPYNFANDKDGVAYSVIQFTGGYGVVPPGVYFNGDFTLTVWVNVQSFGSYGSIIDFANGPGSDNVKLQVAVGGSGYPAITLYSGTSNSVRVQSSATISLNTWYNLAFSLSNLTYSIFINGVVWYSGTSTVVPQSVLRSSNYIVKSNWEDAIAQVSYDEIKIYRRALSSSEILLDYTQKTYYTLV